MQWSYCITSYIWCSKPKLKVGLKNLPPDQAELWAHWRVSWSCQNQEVHTVPLACVQTATSKEVLRAGQCRWSGLQRQGHRPCESPPQPAALSPTMPPTHLLLKPVANNHNCQNSSVMYYNNEQCALQPASWHIPQILITPASTTTQPTTWWPAGSTLASC